MALPSRLDTRAINGKPKVRSPSHRDWVRLHRCCVPGCQNMPIECAHVRRASTAGMGLKSSDAFCLSLCATHHARAHAMGEKSFERAFGIDMAALAREFYERSPYRKRLDNPYSG